MKPIAEATWPAIFARAIRDLGPAPGRFGMAWRIALLCALVTAAAMLFKIPEAAISCYLVIFLMRPDASETIGQAVGLIGLASVIVLVMAPLITATMDSAFLRLLVMATVSFVMLYLSSATSLGETGAIIGLVVAFIMTLSSDVPAGIVASQGLLYAWQMAVMPMLLMIVFCLALGRSPHGLAADKIAARLNAAAGALEAEDTVQALHELLAEGNDDLAKKVQVARLLHLAPARRTRWLAGAVDTSYRLMLATAALPNDAARARARLSAACRAAAAAVSEDRRPVVPDSPATTGSPAEAVAWEALRGLAQSNGGADPAPKKSPFLAPDALTNPDHQRYALKTTAAAMICYLIYTGIGWDGIHTAMITCYVAALGTTGETVHKLALRIVGCLIGAILGVGAIVFVIPQLQSIGGLMVLVFAGILVAGWVAAGSERIAYAGVQIGLAFLLTILNGFGPSTDMSAAGDRIAGILLGNVIVYLIFTGIWPRSAIAAVRDRLEVALRALSRAAAFPSASPTGRIDDVATATVALAGAREGLFLLPFEPRRQQPGKSEVRRIAALIESAAALAPGLAIGDTGQPTLSERLSGIAAALGQNGLRSEDAPGDAIALRPLAGNGGRAKSHVAN
ncbi:FUSC family protein [Microbaculum marinum]|uniref:FUSC family protein n=1 Tax=Microbaculum marinum TaxID=1764581 RepID=A0AAW9RM73_9HYPH